MQKVALNLPQNGQNTRKQPKKHKKTAKNCKDMAKIKFKSPKLFANQSPWAKSVMNSRKYALKTGKMTRNAIKRLQKCKKLGKNKKMTNNHNETP